jgi:uncharacterized damage-inducible protein DinB
MGWWKWRELPGVINNEHEKTSMNKEDILLLYEYDRWANNRVFSSLATLTREQFVRNLNGSFPSVRDTALHILAGEWNWLGYWKAPSHDAGILAELHRQREILFRPEAFPDLAAVWRKWLEIEREQIEFIDRLTDESLRRTYPARDTHLSLAHLLQHVANHSTYHRGQISLMMRQLAAEPVATDFHVFLAER